MSLGDRPKWDTAATLFDFITFIAQIVQSFRPIVKDHIKLSYFLGNFDFYIPFSLSLSLIEFFFRTCEFQAKCYHKQKLKPKFSKMKLFIIHLFLLNNAEKKWKIEKKNFKMNFKFSSVSSAEIS